jgi:hypothetical protein
MPYAIFKKSKLIKFNLKLSTKVKGWARDKAQWFSVFLSFMRL